MVDHCYLYAASLCYMGIQLPNSKRGTAALPHFSVHVYCGQTVGHSQQLLSSCCTAHGSIVGYVVATWRKRLNVCFLWPTRVHHNPNGISIGSAVFAGLTSVTDRQTDRPRYLVGNGPHLRTHPDWTTILPWARGKRMAWNDSSQYMCSRTLAAQQANQVQSQ